jgi:hypothetical protein
LHSRTTDRCSFSKWCGITSSRAALTVAVSTLQPAARLTEPSCSSPDRIFDVTGKLEMCSHVPHARLTNVFLMVVSISLKGLDLRFLAGAAMVTTSYAVGGGG